MKKPVIQPARKEMGSQGVSGSILPPRGDEKEIIMAKLAMEEKLKNSQKMLKENYKVTTWGDKFAQLPLDTKQLNSVFLKDNQDFNECISMINEYNIEVVESREKQRQIKNGPWRSKFYNQLMGLLREVMFTKNRMLQKQFAAQVHQWAEDQMMKAEITSQEKDQEKKRSTSTNKSMSNAGGTGVLDQSSSGNATTFLRPISAVNNSTTYLGRGQSADPQHRMLNLTATTRPQSGLIRPESGFIRPDSAAFNQTDGEIAKTVRFLSDVPHVPQPSEIIQQVLRDYQNGHRTKHPDCDPPADRIQDYKRRVLSFDEPTSILQKPGVKKSDEIKYKFPKPIIHQPDTVIQQSHTDRKEEEILQPPGQVIPPVIEGEKPPVPTNPDGTPIAPVLGPDGQPLPGQEQQPIFGPDGQPIIPPAGEGVDEEPEGGQDGEDGQGPPPDAIQISPQEMQKGILMPEIKPYVRDDYGEEPFQRDLNKQFEVRSNYIYYQPSDDPREIAMEQKWLYNRNQQIADQRQEEEMIQHIKEWSQAKGKLTREISRKADSAIYGSKFHLCEYKPQKHSIKELQEMDRRQIIERAQNQGPDESLIIPLMVIDTKDKNQDDSGLNEYEDDQQDIEKINEALGNPGAMQLDDQSFMQDLSKANVVDLSAVLPKIGQPQLQPKPKEYLGIEQSMNQRKITMARQMHGDLIGVSQKNSEEDQSNLTMLPSLSIYSKPRAHQSLRPFSAVFEKVNQDIIRQEQLEEIEEVKNRLAQYKINVPIKQIMESILIPEGIEPDKAGLLPEPGFGLMENPFFKAGQQKQKQKGKGGKGQKQK